MAAAKSIPAGKYVHDEADGEWFDFTLVDGVRQQCCDCGLIHDILVRRKGRRLQMRFVRHERATSSARRFKKKRVIIVEE